MDGGAFGYPIRSLADVPPGEYRVQALLNRYQTYERADGHVVKLPPDRGEGQVWNREARQPLLQPGDRSRSDRAGRPPSTSSSTRRFPRCRCRPSPST